MVDDTRELSKTLIFMISFVRLGSRERVVDFSNDRLMEIAERPFNDADRFDRLCACVFRALARAYVRARVHARASAPTRAHVGATARSRARPTRVPAHARQDAQAHVRTCEQARACAHARACARKRAYARHLWMSYMDVPIYD